MEIRGLANGDAADVDFALQRSLYTLRRPGDRDRIIFQSHGFRGTLFAGGGEATFERSLPKGVASC